jgi:hypothetical protein
MTTRQHEYTRLGRVGPVTISRDADGVLWLTHKGEDVSYEAAMAQENPWDAEEVFLPSTGSVPVWELIHDICTKAT